MPSFTLPCPHCGSANEGLSGASMRTRGSAVWLACTHCGQGFLCSQRDCAGRGERPMQPAGIALGGSASAAREGPQGQGQGAQDLLDANLELAEYLASLPSPQDLEDLDDRYRVSSLMKGRH